MSRNGSGTYSVPNSFTAGTTITASDHNENWSDAGSEITNSVAADGQTSMTGPLKASNGTAAAPGLTFASDTDTGVYRIGADNVGVAVAGAKVLDVSSTGLDVTGTVKQNALTLRPIGEITDYAGSTAPSGFLLCYGQAISRTTYAALFAVISTTFGTGDGSTTFNVPDLRNRAAIGKGDMGGSSSGRISTTHFGGGDPNGLGATGGDDGTTIAQGNLPSATLSGTTSGGLTYSKPEPSSVSSDAIAFTGAGTPVENVWSGGNVNAAATTTGTLTAEVALGGSGTEISRIPPSIILNKIIFAGV